MKIKSFTTNSVKKVVSIMLLSILLLSTFFVVPISANAVDTVTYSYVITTNQTINGFEGKVVYPADKLSVNSITLPYGISNNKNGNIIFVYTNAQNNIDFSQGRAIITVEFNVLNNYSKTEVYSEMSEFFDLKNVFGDNIPFDYANVFDGVTENYGHTDIDNPSNNFQSDKYDVVYSYKENPSDDNITYKKPVQSNLSDISTIAEINIPYIKNPYYTNYTVEHAELNNRTIYATLGCQTKKYDVYLDGVSQGKYEYLDTATITTNTEKDFLIDGNLVNRGTSFSFFVTDNIDVTTEEPTGTFVDSASLIANALYISDNPDTNKSTVKMELLVSATSTNYKRMGVAFAATPQTNADLKNTINNITTSTGSYNKIAVHNSTVDYPNQSGQYQFIYAPYASVDKVNKDKSLYFYAFVEDKNGNITISTPSQINFANVLV